MDFIFVTLSGCQIDRTALKQLQMHIEKMKAYEGRY